VTGVLLHLPLRTRNPLNGQMGNSRLAAVIRSRERAKHREVTRLLVVARHASPEFPGEPYVVTLTRVSAGSMDDDGLAASMKGVRDGIAEALGIDDGERARLLFRYRQRKGKQRHHEVEVLIETRVAKEGAAQ
jgi:hypothetical protein